MSAPINDGGPAYPVPGLQHDESFNGLSLRDYFASEALNGLICHLVGVKDGSPDDYARRAYQYADAMLKARG